MADMHTSLYHRSKAFYSSWKTIWIVLPELSCFPSQSPHWSPDADFLCFETFPLETGLDVIIS